MFLYDIVYVDRSVLQFMIDVKVSEFIRTHSLHKNLDIMQRSKVWLNRKGRRRILCSHKPFVWKVKISPAIRVDKNITDRLRRRYDRRFFLLKDSCQWRASAPMELG